MSKNILSQTLKYLDTYSPYCSPVKTTIYESLVLNYHSLHFNYLSTPVEIRIYNSQFIEVRCEGEPKEICCDIVTVRQAIDNLQRLRYAYER